MDDLGAGALVDLQPFGLPHEPTVRESIQAGADVVLFSGDKLIGAGQCGVIVGRKALIEKLRKHPLMRAVRVDKTCLMVLERTLQLFRDPARLPREHPTYRMICTPPDALKARAKKLARLISAAAPAATTEIAQSQAFLGSGSLPTEALASFVVTVSLPEMSASDLARKLRLDRACVFGRIENDRVCLDVRTLADEQVPAVAAAFGRRRPMTALRRNIMLGTAGHVDHGKSALVKLLTGCETDTLAEEKQRGLTIDLGFAPLPTGRQTRGRRGGCARPRGFHPQHGRRRARH